MRINYFANILILILFISIFDLASSESRNSSKKYSKFVNYFKPFQYEIETIKCKSEKSIFIQGTCVACIEIENHNKIFEKNKNFKTRKAKDSNKYFTKKINKLIKKLNGRNNCLKDILDIKKLRINEGAKFLNGISLRVVTIVREPFVKKENGNYGGTLFEILKSLRKKYNFGINVVLPYDGNWGSLLLNGSFNGLIGMVQRNKSDIGVAPLSVTDERAKAVYFTEYFHLEPSAILIPAPKEKEKITALIRPLSLEVWIGVVLTIGVLIPLLYFINRVKVQIGRNNGNEKPGNFKNTMGSLTLWLFGSLLQESVTSPVSKNTRLLTILWWFITLVITNIYIGFLISELSAPKLYNSVDSLEELVEKRTIKWTFRKNTAHHALFKSSSSAGIYKKVGDGVEMEDLAESDNKGYELVVNKGFAFIKELSFLEVVLDRDLSKKKACEITLAKKTFFNVGFALALQKTSAFKAVMDHEILTSISTGLMEKWKYDNWPKKLFCKSASNYIISTRPRFKKLSLQDIEVALFILGIGVVFSIIGFFIERLNYFKEKKKMKGKLNSFFQSGNFPNKFAYYK